MTSGSMNTRLAKVLFTYRLSPQSTTGVSPSELLLGKRPRTRLDLLRPIAERVENEQFRQKVRHDATAKSRTFHIEDSVFVKNHSGIGQRWLPGKVVKKTGPVSYVVELQDGRQKRCHLDQLRSRETDDDMQDMSETVMDDSIPISLPTGSSARNVELSTTDATVSMEHQHDSPHPAESSELPQRSSVQSYPRRQRKPREWFEPGKN